MSTYTQYEGSFSQTTMATQLLDNTAPYACVRVGERQYLFISGDISKDGDILTFTECKTWLYTTYTGSYAGQPTLEYNPLESGTVSLISDTPYLYTTIEGFPQISVREVVASESIAPWAIFGLIVVLVCLVGFKRFRRGI